MKHKFTFPITTLVAFLCATISLTSCKKDNETENNGPTVSSSTATNIGRGWATINGSVKTINETCTVSFEYGTTNAYGLTILGMPDVIAADTSKSIYANLTGLNTNTKYYYRLKAEFPGETKYGGEMSFTTTAGSTVVINFNPVLSYGSLTDIDGNTYKTIDIGDQTWMAENLKVTRYNDGTEIPFVPVATVWYSLSTPGYCWYKSDSVGYGGLYNWYSINDKLCPAGWHVPDNTDWGTLITFLGTEAVAGGKLKEAGTVHWNDPNYGATNESGFTALPAGYRSIGGIYSSVKHKGYWWSATELPSGEAYYLAMGYNYTYTDKSNTSKLNGFSIRCVRDN